MDRGSEDNSGMQFIGNTVTELIPSHFKNDYQKPQEKQFGKQGKVMLHQVYRNLRRQTRWEHFKSHRIVLFTV